MLVLLRCAAGGGTSRLTQSSSRIFSSGSTRSPAHLDEFAMLAMLQL
jgi:hypothetical protein